MTRVLQEAELRGARLQHVWLLPSHRLFGKTLAVRETTVLGFGSVSFFFCQVNRSHVATNWEGFAYHYVNEISFMLEKSKKNKKKTKRPKDANSFRTWIQTEQAAE